MNQTPKDDLFHDFSKNDKNTTHSKQQKSNDLFDDDWSDFGTDTKKPTTNTTVKRQDDDSDDDQDNGWNRAGGSNTSYTPSFGGGGTLTNTLTAHGQDTSQRIVNQPRLTRASGSRNVDDLFRSSPPKTTTSIDMDKKKKTARFDDFDLTRRSTVPSPSGTAQNRSNPGVLSSLRTGLEPNKSFDIFSSTKKTTDSNKSNDWLGLKDDSSDEDI